MDRERLAMELFRSSSRTFPVRLWSGLELAPEGAPGVRGCVVLRDPSVLEEFLPPASEARLAEAFIDGRLDLEGDLVALLEAAARWEGPRPGLALAPALLALAGRRALRRGEATRLAARLRGRRHSVSRDREAIRHHYDVSDAFYRLFLDDAMVYSCAYFPRGDETLEEAQRAKLELVCRKLSLGPADRFLDVGCGWGALVEHAATRHGARAQGITVSENQLAAARARLGDGPGAKVAAADYRTVRPEEPFDKVASVGMMEHVGRARLLDYFRAVHRLLRPGGLFLNHAIAYGGIPGTATLSWAGQRGGGFIWRYVFPDGELPRIHEVVTAAVDAGFEVRDLECLREHYAETLAHWLARLEARADEAVAIAGARRTRLFRLYLAGSAAAFRTSRNGVYQLLLAKRTATGRAEGLPRCRAEWTAGLAGAAPESPRPARLG
jgi:cyclopropane-fatty-acyl-phospholipid synthase